MDIRTAQSATALVLALSIAVGCGPREATGPTSASAPARTLGTASAARVVDDGPDETDGGKVTARLCERWGVKFASLMIVAYRANMHECVKAITFGDPATNGTAVEIEANAAFARKMDESSKQFVQGCDMQHGKSFYPKDGHCFIDATSPRDWAICDFQTPFFGDFTSLGQAFDRVERDQCDEVTSKVSGGVHVP